MRQSLINVLRIFSVCFLFFGSAFSVEVDKSGFASVSFKDGQWKVLNRLVDWKDDPNVVARANFSNSQQETGWMYLEVQTRETADDKLQARGAGIVEGYLTRTYIVEQFKEFFTTDTCTQDPGICGWLRNQFRTNSKYVKEQVSSRSQREPYWHQVGLLFEQMDGISQGYKLKSVQSNLSDVGMDPDFGILMTNYMADVWDMNEQYKLLKNTPSNKQSSRPSCSVIIKHVPDRKDILLAHNTWFDYRAMGYRFLKNYQFNFHLLPDQKTVVPARTISMSSYAGQVSSMDDFYLTSAGLATTETTLWIYENELLRHNSPEGVVYEPLRVMTANRLSTSGKQWADYFKQQNSGTYNNEWMIVDYNLLKESPLNLKEGVLTVLEQLPGKIIIQDQTEVLRRTSYWSSYNRAFYPEVFEMSGGKKLAEEFGDFFTHDETVRARIFRRDHGKVHDIQSLTYLMRYNDFRNDPLAVVEGCSPSRIPTASIANRLDLADPRLTCTFIEYEKVMLEFGGYGALDAKMASKESFPSLVFTSVAGPTHQGLPPFQWSKTSLSKIPLFRPIDKFDFETHNHTWVLNGANISLFSSRILIFLGIGHRLIKQLLKCC